MNLIIHLWQWPAEHKVADLFFKNYFKKCLKNIISFCWNQKFGSRSLDVKQKWELSVSIKKQIKRAYFKKKKKGFKSLFSTWSHFQHLTLKKLVCFCATRVIVGWRSLSQTGPAVKRRSSQPCSSFAYSPALLLQRWLRTISFSCVENAEQTEERRSCIFDTQNGYRFLARGVVWRWKEEPKSLR